MARSHSCIAASVTVSVFATRKTITVRAGHSFLARALTARKRRK